jgi:hypothetical protein
MKNRPSQGHTKIFFPHRTEEKFCENIPVPPPKKFIPENGDSMFHQNICIRLQDYTVAQLIRPHCEVSLHMETYTVKYV